MLFPTFTFILLFLPLTVIVYFLLARKHAALSKAFLVLASFVFYSWFNWSYSLILAGSILVNWAVAQRLHARKSRLVLAAGIAFNILLLGYFKYFNFFVENINSLFNASFAFKHVLLPIGISFFTFQQISFLHLVYSDKLAKRCSFCNYALFVSFFPKLIAGPLVPPDEMMSQFEDERNSRVNYDNISSGIFIFALGLAKKILLADFFMEISDSGFAACNGNFFATVATVLAYTLQIYFDFSGYCDMATGVAKMLNIQLTQNFNAPYKAENIADFWRKWHITLGRFLTDNIYIPLGGNRCGKFRSLLNLWIVFLISGLWHGAGWLFILWGALHGTAIVIHRIWSRYANLKMPKIPAQILTFLFVALAWVPFRAETMETTRKIYRGIFLPSSFSLETPEMFNVMLFIAGFAIILFLPTSSDACRKFRPTWINLAITVALILVSMFLFVKITPFIYTNF